MPFLHFFGPQLIYMRASQAHASDEPSQLTPHLPKPSHVHLARTHFVTLTTSTIRCATVSSEQLHNFPGRLSGTKYHMQHFLKIRKDDLLCAISKIEVLYSSSVTIKASSSAPELTFKF